MIRPVIMALSFLAPATGVVEIEAFNADERYRVCTDGGYDYYNRTVYEYDLKQVGTPITINNLYGDGDMQSGFTYTYSVSTQTTVSIQSEFDLIFGKVGYEAALGIGQSAVFSQNVVSTAKPGEIITTTVYNRYVSAEYQYVRIDERCNETVMKVLDTAYYHKDLYAVKKLGS